MTSRSELVTDTAIASIGSKVTYTGTGVTMVGWMTVNELAAWVGIAMGVVGLLVNWHYKHKADQRAVERDKWEREMANAASKAGRTTGRFQAIVEDLD